MKKILPVLIFGPLVTLGLFGAIAYNKVGKPDGGFTYAIPSGFRDEPPENGASRQFRRDTAHGAIICAMSSQLNPVFYVTWDSFLTDAGDQVIGKIKRQIEGQIPGSQLLSHTINKTHKLPLLAYTYSIPSGPNGPRAGTGLALFFIAGATQYNFTCTTPLADEAAARAAMNQMMSSFKFG